MPLLKVLCYQWSSNFLWTCFMRSQIQNLWLSGCFVQAWGNPTDIYEILESFGGKDTPIWRRPHFRLLKSSLKWYNPLLISHFRTWTKQSPALEIGTKRSRSVKVSRCLHDCQTPQVTQLSACASSWRLWKLWVGTQQLSGSGLWSSFEQWLWYLGRINIRIVNGLGLFLKQRSIFVMWLIASVPQKVTYAIFHLYVDKTL